MCRDIAVLQGRTVLMLHGFRAGIPCVRQDVG